MRRVRSAALTPAVLICVLPAGATAAPLFGVTIDRVSHLKDVVSSLAALPERPTTRIYYDTHEPASHYAGAVQQIGRVSGVMGELLDSSQERSISVSAYGARVASYLQTLGARSQTWEIGNEVNGNWTGSYEAVAAKLGEAYELVSRAGGATALTLYANEFAPDNCGDGAAELTPVQFSQRYVPAAVANGLDYVLLSYYPTQCAGREPSDEEVRRELGSLHALYPNAQLGFGEVGLPRRASKGTRAQAEQIMGWAYSLDPGLPYYAGGYFWWYGFQDALRPQGLLRADLAAAFEDESAALTAG